MCTDIVVLFVHFALDIQIENTFHAGRFHGSGHSRQQCVRFDVREILVHQAVGRNDCFVGHNGALGEGGAIADPDILAEDNGFGQRANLPIAIEILHVMERRVHKLAVPSGAHVAADDNPVKAENLEVGAEINFSFAKLQRRVIGDHHV